MYRRLRASLDAGIERPFFEHYFKACRARLGDRLPALVPQVYLHYDPKSVHERVRLAAAAPRPAATDGDALPLPRQRMDFLLLLPGQVRVVLELDGQQHYAVGADAGAAASPAQYARMVSADRDLRLDGYEVYRFGGYELQAGRLDDVVGSFFARLFARHGVA
ncbi:hypothetical protein [Roseisolibacter agri]|uniref:DUF559 domain-containing protein n=1 Tax=Roseisolibacter agri TaxID=2014610 RepID=A0AA37V2R6_9BACT|nr:hypothetical protein [Roseisolibacter agri]GLC28240.1 hypothetical protein rosag_47530 [Roseisolibacter agri]